MSQEATPGSLLISSLEMLRLGLASSSSTVPPGLEGRLDAAVTSSGMIRKHGLKHALVVIASYSVDNVRFLSYLCAFVPHIFRHGRV